MKTIHPASHVSTNKRIFELIIEGDLLGKRILDIGAGKGYMAQLLGKKIIEKGGNPAQMLTACDLFPEYFEYDAIPCEKLNFLTTLPYDDKTFDIVYAVEVIEHLRNPYEFLGEMYRILRPEGKCIITTPNVLNINSRLSYFFNGFFTLFGPVSCEENESGTLAGHIMPLNYYYLDYGMRKEGFSETELHIDRIKKSAVFLLILLFPYIALSSLKYRLKISRKNPLLYKANENALKKINSFSVLCSRSCILVGIK